MRLQWLSDKQEATKLACEPRTADSAYQNLTLLEDFQTIQILVMFKVSHTAQRKIDSLDGNQNSHRISQTLFSYHLFLLQTEPRVHFALMTSFTNEGEMHAYKIQSPVLNLGSRILNIKILFIEPPNSPFIPRNIIYISQTSLLQSSVVMSLIYNIFRKDIRG